MAARFIFNVDDSRVAPGLSLRVTEIDGTSWFVAADVCAILDMEDTATALRNIPEKHKAKKVWVCAGNRRTSPPRPACTAW